MSDDPEVFPDVTFPKVGDVIEALLDGRAYVELKIERILWTNERRLVWSPPEGDFVEVPFDVPYMLIGIKGGIHGGRTTAILWSHVSSWQMVPKNEQF